MEKTEFDRIVGENILKRRKAMGLSQERLASLLGVSFQQVQKYEKGTNSPGMHRAVRLAQILRCRVGDLYEAGPGPRKRTVDEAFDALSIAFVETIYVVSVAGRIPMPDARLRCGQIEDISRQMEELKSYLLKKSR